MTDPTPSTESKALLAVLRGELDEARAVIATMTSGQRERLGSWCDRYGASSGCALVAPASSQRTAGGWRWIHPWEIGVIGMHAPGVLAEMCRQYEQALTLGWCPRCGSPAPNLHPAMQHEGEVQPCPDPFHHVTSGSKT